MSVGFQSCAMLFSCLCGSVCVPVIVSRLHNQMMIVSVVVCRDSVFLLLGDGERRGEAKR